MNLFELYATISLDTDAYESGLKAAKRESESFTSKFKTAFSNAAKVGTALTAAIGAVGTAISVLGIEAAADAKALESQFSQTFKEMSGSAEDAVSRVASASGIIDNRLKEAASSIYAFARSSGGEVEESMSLMETALQAAADSAAYYDTSIEEATKTLQSFLKGNYENDAALGLSATETTRNAAAMELFGKKFNELTEIQKQKTLLQMVTDAQELSGAMGQAAREADGWANVTGNLQQAWTDFKAAIGIPLLEQAVPIIQNITTGLIEWTNSVDWNAFSDGIKGFVSAIVDNGPTILAVIAGIGAGFVTWNVTTMIQGVITAINAFSAANEGLKLSQIALNAVLNANPIGIVITVVGTLVAALITLWTTNEDFRNAVIEIWNNIKQTFTNAWEAIKETFANWGEFFSEKWEELKTVFADAWEVFKEIGSNMIDGIKEGIAEVWDTLTTWVSEKWQGLLNMFSFEHVNMGAITAGFGGFTAVDGSHASGLSYVPFDGYIAKLHKGESVLTAVEAERYRKGSAGVNVNQYIYSQAKTAADLMQEALYLQERAVLLGV